MASSTSGQQLELTASQADAVQKALEHWLHTGRIPANLVGNLFTTIQPVEERHKFDWERLVTAHLAIGLTCCVFYVFMPVFKILMQRGILSLLVITSAIATNIFAIAAVAVHAWGYQRSLATPEQPYLNEAIYGLGAVPLFIVALRFSPILELIPLLNAEGPHEEDIHTFNRVLLCLFTVYGITAVLLGSKATWSCCIAVLGQWYILWTDYSTDSYYMSMNYQVRCVLFGAGLILESGLMRDHPLTAAFWWVTRIGGMLHLFITLWTFSWSVDDKIGRYEAEAYGRSGRRAFWLIASFYAATTAIWHGSRYGDLTMQCFGMVFLGINLYTGFCEVLV
ncbi:hypothetical protein F5Y10DRAFT_266035 [Nemania abortiva]|nr:hypothetical protein F5Y10DRAFT_266035 [Nemania abortiva]